MKKKRPDPAERLNRLRGKININKIGEVFERDSSRGQILAMAAAIDRHLGALLKDKFLSSSSFSADEIDRLLASGKQPMLQSLAIRATTAHAFGVVDANLFRAIDAIRKLRNDYAHTETVPRLTKRDIDVVLQHLPSLARGIIRGMRKSKSPIRHQLLVVTWIICRILDDIARQFAPNSGHKNSHPSPVRKRLKKQ